MNERLAHKGDPCIYCGIPHDKVLPGPCSAFTGEIRPPIFDDLFVGLRGQVVRSRIHFEVQKFPIINEKLYLQKKGG